MRSRSLPAFAALLPFSLGCAGNSFEHLLQSVDQGGLTVTIEGHLSPAEVRLYSIRVDPSEGLGEVLFADGTCRLFLDLNGDATFDEATDRSLGIIEVDAPPHAPWIFAPMIATFDEGDPCLAVRVLANDGEERSLSFALGVG